MAPGAAAGPEKVLLAGGCIARLKIGDIYTAASPGMGCCLLLLVVDKGRYAMDFINGKIKCRHLLFRTPIADDLTNLVSVHIGQRQFGARKIRPCFSAGRISSMTEGAVALKKVPACFRTVRCSTRPLCCCGKIVAMQEAEQGRKFLLRQFWECGHSSFARLNERRNLLVIHLPADIEQRREPRQVAFTVVSMTDGAMFGIALRAFCIAGLCSRAGC